jgi:hypothetical protein
MMLNAFKSDSIFYGQEFQNSRIPGIPGFGSLVINLISGSLRIVGSVPILYFLCWLFFYPGLTNYTLYLLIFNLRTA